MGFARLVGQLEAILEESGDGTPFDARAWIARWLSEPLPAFGGIPDGHDGGPGLVAGALAKIQSGVYA